jgi:hypothetical protein
MSELMAIYADKQKAEAAVMNRPDLSNAAKKEAMDDIEEMYQAAKQDVLARQAKGKKRERLEELAAGASMTKVEMAESHKPLQRKYVAHSKWSSHDLLRKSIHEAEEGNWLTPFAGRKGSSKKIRTHFVMTNGCCFMANGDDEPTRSSWPRTTSRTRWTTSRGTSTSKARSARRRQVKPLMRLRRSRSRSRRMSPPSSTAS